MNGKDTKKSGRDFYSFFTREWWESVVEEWNTSEYRTCLSCLKKVSFTVPNTSYKIVIIDWDSQGEAKFDESILEEIPTFSASINSWYAFINGEFSAAEGVMKGKIKFKGSLVAILPFIGGFNYLARVAKSVTNPNEKLMRG